MLHRLFQTKFEPKGDPTSAAELSLAFWDKEGKKLDLFMSHCLVFTAFVWKWRILNYCKLSVSIPLHRELLQKYNYSRIEFEFVKNTNLV